MTRRPKPYRSTRPVSAAKSPADPEPVAAPAEVSGSSKWHNWAATVAAIASAVAAICAVVVSMQERSTPYKTALFTARWDAIKDYAEASTSLQQELTRLQESMPLQITTTKGVASLTDAQIKEIADEAFKVFPAWQHFIEVSNGSAAFYSLQTNEVIDAAMVEGMKLRQCYWVWGRRIVRGANSKAAIDFRRERATGAVSVCDQALKQKGKSSFDWAADKVLRAMTNELRDNTDQFVPEKPHDPYD